MSAPQKLDLWPFFLKHPQRALKLPEAMCGSKLERPRVVCRRCFLDLVHEIRKTQEREVENGRRTVAQSEEDIKISRMY
jgi:hypothetical protein